MAGLPLGACFSLKSYAFRSSISAKLTSQPQSQGSTTSLRGRRTSSNLGYRTEMPAKAHAAVVTHTINGCFVGDTVAKPCTDEAVAACYFACGICRARHSVLAGSVGLARRLHSKQYTASLFVENLFDISLSTIQSSMCFIDAWWLLLCLLKGA